MNKMYPDLDNIIEEIEDEQVIDKDKLATVIKMNTNKNLFKDRYQLMEYKKDNVFAALSSYMKNKQRYNTAASVVKVVGVTTTLGLAVVTIIFTSGVAAPFFIVPMCSGLAVFSMGASESIQKLLKRKKHRQGKKINLIRDTMSKIEIFIEKAREDGVVTPEEIEKFTNIIRAGDNKLANLKKKVKGANHQGVDGTNHLSNPFLENLVKKTIRDIMLTDKELAKT